MLDIDPGARRALKLLLIGTLAAGALAALARPTGIPGLPFGLIAPVWTLIYILMAVAAWLAWKKGGWRTWAMTLYAGQLVLNLFWRAWPTQILSLLLVLFMLLTLVALWRRNSWAALAFLPCLAWIVFVTVSSITHWHLY